MSPKAKKITREFKAGEVVWVRGIVSHECASWVEVYFNKDQHSLYIEDLRDVRRASRTRRGK